MDGSDLLFNVENKDKEREQEPRQFQEYQHQNRKKQQGASRKSLENKLQVIQEKKQVL